MPTLTISSLLPGHNILPAPGTFSNKNFKNQTPTSSKASSSQNVETKVAPDRNRDRAETTRIRGGMDLPCAYCMSCRRNKSERPTGKAPREKKAHSRTVDHTMGSGNIFRLSPTGCSQFCSTGKQHTSSISCALSVMHQHGELLRNTGVHKQAAVTSGWRRGTTTIFCSNESGGELPAGRTDGR